MSKEPTLAEMHKHYAEALRVINRLREENMSLKTSLLTYLRDLKFSNSALLLTVERRKLDDTIAALEKSIAERIVDNHANKPDKYC